jgi:hypothetical protein
MRMLFYKEPLEFFFSVCAGSPLCLSNSKGSFKSSKDLKWGDLGIQVLPLAPTLDQALICKNGPLF